MQTIYTFQIKFQQPQVLDSHRTRKLFWKGNYGFYANEKHIQFFKKRLPLKQREIQAKGWPKTSTFNCHVKAFLKTDDGKCTSVRLEPSKAVDDIKGIASRETKIGKTIQHESIESPTTSKASVGQYSSLSKRPWFSVDDVSVQILVNFCMEEQATTF